MLGDGRIIERRSSEVNGISALAARRIGLRSFVQSVRQLLRVRRGDLHPRPRAWRLACALLVVGFSWLVVASTDSPGPPAPRWAVAVLPGGEEFSLEVAVDDASRARGYMFRESVGRREGMLFVFDRSDRHSFWMKNCRVRLDIIWMDPGFRVVDIAHDLSPCPEDGACPSVQPSSAARYALELAGGTARRSGLHQGHRVVVLSEPPLH